MRIWTEGWLHEDWTEGWLHDDLDRGVGTGRMIWTEGWVLAG